MNKLFTKSENLLIQLNSIERSNKKMDYSRILWRIVDPFSLDQVAQEPPSLK